MLKKWFLLALVLILALSLSDNVYGRGGGGVPSIVPDPYLAYSGQTLSKITLTGTGFQTSGISNIAFVPNDVTFDNYTVVSDTKIELNNVKLTGAATGLKLMVLTTNDPDNPTSYTFFIVGSTNWRCKLTEQQSALVEAAGLNDVLACGAALDGRTYIGGGTFGKVYKTVNSGKTWSKMIVGDQNTHFTCMDFYNSSIGYMGGFRMVTSDLGGTTITPKIYYTSDGGETWTAQTLPAPTAAKYLAVTDLAIAPDDPNIVVAVCASDQIKSPMENMFRTVNGSTWTLHNVETLADFPALVGVDILKNNAGKYNVYAVGGSLEDIASIVGASLTRMGGVTKMGVGAPDVPLPKNVLFKSTSNGDDGSWTASLVSWNGSTLVAGIRIKMTDLNNGYMTGALLNAKAYDGKVIKIAGDSFQDVTPSNPFVYDLGGSQMIISLLLGALDVYNNSLMVGGVYGGLFGSSDGGQNWTQYPYDYRAIFDINIIDADNAVVWGEGWVSPRSSRPSRQEWDLLFQ